MITPRPSQRAFTAMELLAATALASVLMLAVMAVIGSIGRTRSSVEHHQGTNPWLSQIAPLIRQDLLASTSIDLHGQILLKGYAAIDPITLARTHQPAEVRYLIRQAGTTSLLLRQQKTYSAAAGVQVFTQIVSLGVTSITLKDLEEHERVHLVIAPSTPSGPSVDQIVILQ